MITCAIEPLATARRDIEAILPVQWRETGDVDLVPTPNWQVYEALERAGGFLLVARDAGRFCGYLACAVHPHLNASARVATISTYWVEPRLGRVFVLRGLMRAALRHLRDRGVRTVTIDTHAGYSAGRLLEAMGFREAKISYNLDLHGDSAHAGLRDR